ncbi:MAG: glycosyltransferase [Nitrospirae bacterium]|nr:glycosyltransferase [Nitrospirota bacterium]
MKVLHVNIAINPKHGGGTAERVYQMSKHLSQKGIVSAILTLELGLTEDLQKTLKSVEITAIPCLWERFFVPEISYKILTKIYNSIKTADIIHLMGHWSLVNALAYLFIRYLNKPYVFCPAGALIIHGRSKFLKLLYNKLIGNAILTNANVCIASTKSEIKYFYKCIPKDNIVIIPNGINSNEFILKNDDAFRKKYNIGSNPFILYMGTFSHIKGTDLLLQAFNRIKDKYSNYHIVLAGNDRGLLNEIKRYTRKTNIESTVHFIGYIEGIDKSYAYNAATILVVPSRSEVISMVALEAGSTSTPVLLTDKCGFNEITEIEGGLVVEDSVEGLEKGLTVILSDLDKLKKIGKNISEYVKNTYEWHVIIDKYIKLYHHVLNNTRLNLY